MNPLVKTCLIDSHQSNKDTNRTEVSEEEEEDPYFDENNVARSDSMDTSTSSMKPVIADLGINIMGRHKDRDPLDVYEPAKVLGTGSMGTVSMVKKRKDAVGGSARVKNLSTRSRLEMHGVHPLAIKICTVPILGPFFESCTGLEEYTKSTPLQDINDSSHGTGLPKGLSEVLDNMGSVGNFGKLVAMNISNHQPNHIRINKVLKRDREMGNYEPYYALKSIHFDRVNDVTFVSELKNEISILRRLDHAHISRLIETYGHNGNMYLVLELCSGGDLYTRDPYTEDQAARIVNSIMSAVAFMHDHGIMHRDLKYENVMFANSSPKAEVKIIDFGLSKRHNPDAVLKEGVGTVYTMSPQVLEGNYTNKADVWAIGVLAYMLLSSQMPFYGRKRTDILDKIMNCDFDYKGRRWGMVSRQAKSFVADLLQYDQDYRPSAEEATQSLWLNMKMSSSVRTANEDDMEAVATSFESYSKLPTLKKLGLMIIAHNCTSEEIGRLRKAFKKYDKKKNGLINLEEFSACLSIYGWNQEYIKDLFRAVDLDGTGTIKYTEFLAATIQTTGLVTEERVAEAFDRLDSDDSGFISFRNLRDLFGADVPKEYINQIIAEADIKHDRKISYDEFLAMWEGELEVNQIEELAGIGNNRTVNDIAIDVVDDDSSDGDESSGILAGNLSDRPNF